MEDKYCKKGRGINYVDFLEDIYFSEEYSELRPKIPENEQRRIITHISEEFSRKISSPEDDCECINIPFLGKFHLQIRKINAYLKKNSFLMGETEKDISFPPGKTTGPLTKYFLKKLRTIVMKHFFNSAIEYLSAFGKAVNDNPSKLVEGIWNSVTRLGFLNELEKQEVARRRLICTMCPFMSTNAKSSHEYKELFGDNYKSDRVDEHCSLCGCNIELKTASLVSKCGIANSKEALNKGYSIKWYPYGEEKNKRDSS